MTRIALALALLATSALVGCVNDVADPAEDADVAVEVETDTVDTTSAGRPGPMPCPNDPRPNCVRPVKR